MLHSPSPKTSLQTTSRPRSRSTPTPTPAIGLIYRGKKTTTKVSIILFTLQAKNTGNDDAASNISSIASPLTRLLLVRGGKDIGWLVWDHFAECLADRSHAESRPSRSINMFMKWVIGAALLMQFAFLVRFPPPNLLDNVCTWGLPSACLDDALGSGASTLVDAQGDVHERRQLRESSFFPALSATPAFACDLSRG